MKYLLLVFTMVFLISLTSCGSSNDSKADLNPIDQSDTPDIPNADQIPLSEEINSNMSPATSTPYVASTTVTAEAALPMDKNLEALLKKENNTADYNTLITKTVDINEFIFFVQTCSSDSKYYYNRYLSIEEFSSQYPIECLRKQRDNVLYSVHKVKQGGLLYVLFAGRSDLNSYSLYTWFYVKKPLRYEEFEAIKEGKSTIEEVIAIDSSAEIFKTTIEEYSKSVDLSKAFSHHYLTNGILTIHYTKEDGKYIVDRIEYSKEFVRGGFSDGSSFDVKIFDMDFIK